MMSDKGPFSELDRALAREDLEILRHHIDVYYAYEFSGVGEWTEEVGDAHSAIFSCEDSEKALAYVVLGAANFHDASFVNLMGCGTLENLLADPTDEFIQRIVTEARRSARFRWMLSCPFKVAVSQKAWKAIEPFRITGAHEEPPLDSMPIAYFS